MKPYIWIYQDYGKSNHVFRYIRDMVDKAIYLDISGIL